MKADIFHHRSGASRGFYFLLFLVLLLPACSVIDVLNTGFKTTSNKSLLATQASLRLSEMEEIDAVVKLNNQWLSSHIEETLTKEASQSSQFTIQDLELSFDNQYIGLEFIVDVSDDYSNRLSGVARGEVFLDIHPNRLDWTAQIHQLVISSNDFSFDGGQYAEAIPELEQEVLEIINGDFLSVLNQNGKNSIPLNVTPLGEIQVGADLPGLSSSPARHTEPLRGVFIKADSVNLIASGYTTFAMDLVFLPNISHCPADVSVSRADYARNIESREPVGIQREKANTGDIRYFFSEIADAIQPLTIIHYWYVNGQPIAVDELTVGASKRWRTWSGGSRDFAEGDHMEVLVVEKETGCILRSKAIEITGQDNENLANEQTAAEKSFKELIQEFNLRTVSLSVEENSPNIAVIKTRRSFITDALRTSLAGLNISGSLDTAGMSSLQWKTRLKAFNPENIACEQRNCPPVPVCETNSSHCKRLRDTRDCTSCLFRNPLNNRCMKEAVDPVCEASRNRQNVRYDADRAACVKNAETSKQECDFLNAQADRSCQIEAAFADNACDSIKTSIEQLKPGAPLAYIQARARPQGDLSVNFSNFRLEGDLERLKLDMSLSSNMQLTGDMNFSPGAVSRPLANCIASWSAPFKSRFANTPTVDNLQSSLKHENSMLVASWSGFGMTIDTNPSPLESVLVGNPQLLANCKIGLTVGKVKQAIAGEDEAFYRGKLNLEIQPLPTKIHLAPASLVLGDNSYIGVAQLYTSSVVYELGN